MSLEDRQTDRQTDLTHNLILYFSFSVVALARASLLFPSSQLYGGCKKKTYRAHPEMEAVIFSCLLIVMSGVQPLSLQRLVLKPTDYFCFLSPAHSKRLYRLSVLQGIRVSGRFLLIHFYFWIGTLLLWWSGFREPSPLSLWYYSFTTPS